MLVLVGFSTGGCVSTVASARLQVDGLFLLAPAFYSTGNGNQEPVPRAQTSMIIHGWGNDVVPVQNSIGSAMTHSCELHLLDGGHGLNDALSKIEPLFELFLMQFMA